MPTIEAITNNIAPKEVTKPIPVRTVQTRGGQKIINQQTTVVEPKAADSAAPAESVRLSPQLTALARKEQAYRQREQALKERERAIEAKLADADKYSQLQAKLAEGDYSPLKELGAEYSKYTKYEVDQLNGEDPTLQQMKQLEAEIQALKKGQEESATQEYEETVAEYKRGISKLVSESDQFPKTKKAGKEDAVLQLILDAWEKDSEHLSIEEAARDVENYLGEEAKKWASLIEQQQPMVEEEKLPPPRVQTLTHNMQPAGESKRPQKSLQHLPEAERYEEARRRALEKLAQGR